MSAAAARWRTALLQTYAVQAAVLCGSTNIFLSTEGCGCVSEGYVLTAAKTVRSRYSRYICGFLHKSEMVTPITHGPALL